MVTWNAALYLKYEKERTQPCVDLVRRIETESVEYAVDLGCGPGNSTAVLADQFAKARVIGVDSSPAMLEQARHHLPQLEFIEGDVATWQAVRPCDVILANAVFQWLPNHEALFPRLLDQLRPGGTLAVQMPRNLDAPNHALMREVAHTGPWAKKISERSPYAVKQPEWYYDLLAPLAASVEMWETEYLHVMEDPAEIVEWGRGTGMRPFLEPLDLEERDQFLAMYLAEIRKAYPLRADGKLLFPFRRLFFLAVR